MKRLKVKGIEVVIFESVLKVVEFFHSNVLNRMAEFCSEIPANKRFGCPIFYFHQVNPPLNPKI